MNSSSLTMFLPLVLLIVAMYFLLIRPQRKREREVNTMRSNLRVGDEIVTIGGICGKIVKTKEETIVLQVGADKVKMELMKWSVSKVVTPAEAKAAKKAEKESAEEVDEEAPKKAKPKRLQKAAAEADEVADAADDAAEQVEEVEAAAAEVAEGAEETVEAAEETVAEAAEEAADEA